MWFTNVSIQNISDQICSGNGMCPCDRCVCTEEGYSGEFCEICVTCSDQVCNVTSRHFTSRRSSWRFIEKESLILDIDLWSQYWTFKNCLLPKYWKVMIKWKLRNVCYSSVTYEVLLNRPNSKLGLHCTVRWSILIKRINRRYAPALRLILQIWQLLSFL